MNKKNSNNNPPPSSDRYSRQTLFAPIGIKGQQNIRNSSVLLIGCGALGTVLAELMVRAGVGKLRLVDRDFVELSNLQRQLLFDENDIAENLPKAQAAARKLRRINSEVEIDPVVADVNHESISHFVNTESFNLILDGTDNFQTRFLINDIAIKNKIPWIYGGCLGASGMGMVIMPEGRPCLQCVVESPPEPGQMETCDTAGIIAPAVGIVANFQAIEALKILSGNLDAVNRNFVTFDLWENRTGQMPLNKLTDGCPCCGDHDFQYLAGKGSLSTISLCGRNSVQIRPRNHNDKINMEKLASRLKETGEVILNDFMIKLNLPNLEITIFPDARAIIKGTSNIDEARTLYARYVGH